MIKKLLIIPTLVFLALLLVATIYVFSGDKRLRDSNIHIENASVYAPLPGQKTALVTLDLVNEGGANQLLSVHTPNASKAMIHKSVEENGIAKMVPMHSVKIQPLTTTRFEKGGLHIMLMNADIPENTEEISLLLTFARPPKRPDDKAKAGDAAIFNLAVQAKVQK